MQHTEQGYYVLVSYPNLSQTLAKHSKHAQTLLGVPCYQVIPHYSKLTTLRNSTHNYLRGPYKTYQKADSVGQQIVAEALGHIKPKPDLAQESKKPKQPQNQTPFLTKRQQRANKRASRPT